MMETKIRCCVLFILISAAFGLGGCDGYYSGYPGYGPYYGAAPSPYYGGGYARTVTVSTYDRPYYIHGAGYYAGRTYYVWKPGHWRVRNGQKVWIHGHYVVRGY